MPKEDTFKFERSVKLVSNRVFIIKLNSRSTISNGRSLKLVPTFKLQGLIYFGKNGTYAPHLKGEKFVQNSNCRKFFGISIGELNACCFKTMVHSFQILK